MANTKKNTVVVSQGSLASAIVNAPAQSIESEKAAAIQTADVILQGVVSGWSAAEQSETRGTVEFAIAGVMSTKETLMAIGDKFNALKISIGREKFADVVNAVSKMNIDGLSKNNLGLWMNRASLLAKTLPSPLVRKHLLALAGGNGIVIRVEPTEDEKKAGETASYQIAPEFASAIASVGKVPTGTVKPSVAESYARRVVDIVKQLRSNANVSPEGKAARQKKAKQAILKAFVNFAKVYGLKAAEQLHNTIEQKLEEMVNDAAEAPEAPASNRRTAATSAAA